MIARGGKVKFKNHASWTIFDKDSEDGINLPNVYNSDYLVEEIDISNMKILYDGLMNLGKHSRQFV